MASNSSSSVGGGKRGKHQSSAMSLGKAMGLQKNSGKKPNLNATPSSESKVTNKPSLAGKRMK